jgi:hypothetical protein
MSGLPPHCTLITVTDGHPAKGSSCRVVRHSRPNVGNVTVGSHSRGGR